MSLLTEYQEFTPTTAIYRRGEGQGDMMYAALELVDEAGEVAGKVKKYYRDGYIDINEVAKEMGDVFYPLAELANHLGISLEDVLRENMKKLTDRQVRGVLSGSGDNR